MRKFFKIIFGGAIIFLNATPVTFAEENLKMDLNDAINLALKNNRAIEQSESDREAAKWNLSAVRRSSGLRLNWSSTANRIGGRYYSDYRANRYAFDNLSEAEKMQTRYRLADFPLYKSETSNSLSLSMPLYSGGRLEAQRKSAEYNLNSADLNLENMRQEVKFQTTQAFYQVLQYRDLMDIQREEMQNLSEHLETVKIQYEVGTVAMSDFLSTNVQLANSQQNFNSAQINFENSVANLNN
jgi:outer membrane protein TolC